MATASGLWRAWIAALRAAAMVLTLQGCWSCGPCYADPQTPPKADEALTTVGLPLNQSGFSSAMDFVSGCYAAPCSQDADRQAADVLACLRRNQCPDLCSCDCGGSWTEVRDQPARPLRGIRAGKFVFVVRAPARLTVFLAATCSSERG